MIDRRRAAEWLQVSADANATVARAAFLRQLGRFNFAVPAEYHDAVRLFDAPTVDRPDVEEFAQSYWSLEPTERRRRWSAMCCECPPHSTAAALHRRLQTRLDEPARYSDGEQLAADQVDFAANPPVYSADRWRQLFEGTYADRVGAESAFVKWTGAEADAESLGAARFRVYETAVPRRELVWACLFTFAMAVSVMTCVYFMGELKRRTNYNYQPIELPPRRLPPSEQWPK